MTDVSQEQWVAGLQVLLDAAGQDLKEVVPVLDDLMGYHVDVRGFVIGTLSCAFVISGIDFFEAAKHPLGGPVLLKWIDDMVKENQR